MVNTERETGDDAFEGGFFALFFFLRLFRRGFLELWLLNGWKRRQARILTVLYRNRRRIGGCPPRVDAGSGLLRAVIVRIAGTRVM